MRALSYVFGCLIGIGSLSVPLAAQQASVADAIVAETEDFQLFCFSNQRCPASDVAAPQRAAAQRGLEELQKARAWLEGMGFDVENADMDPGTDGKKALRLQFDTAIHERRCTGMAAACRTLSVLNESRVILPVEDVDQLADGGTLVHEYVHTLQPSRDDEGVHWLNEMVATAIGSVWVRKRTGRSAVYEPKYSMVLDREFWDGQDDPGYGKWDYAISLGQEIGSQDGVAYLAQDRIINAAADAALRSGNGMTLLYDDALMGGATFDTFFPRYVARFNNVEKDIAQQDRTGKYFYYGDIARHAVEVTSTTFTHEDRFAGKAIAFAAHPMLLPLKVTPTPDTPPSENILLATVEVTEADDPDSLTLIREHRLAKEKLRDSFLLDGNDPPDELGFFRVAHTPAPDSTAENGFVLKVQTRPVSIEPPTCFQAGKPSEMTVTGLPEAAADNWRFKVDNGRAEGRTITPASPGEIAVQVEIDSSITRRETGIAPKDPVKTRVELGTFDVAADDCMVRLTMGPAVMTYVADGSYTEFRSPGGEAMYISESNLAMWQGGGWMNVPAQAKAMILGSMKQNNAALRMEFPGAHDDEGDFMSQMPKIFAKRFGWTNLRNAHALDGGTPVRKSAACPDGGSGCSSIVFSMEGNPVPVTFDAQKRPKVVTFDGQDIVFDYGTWTVRRPPGW
ncbi:hypothetical protein D6850_00840 [Roseovarius spongiae]|uniref:DUF4157 domain-containing protein n=1 Tax=Roseovarius spongiae TaxID=2320272 RepID=A0A3A8AV78_9RHOB|nr:hypothetical protein [Roseovarius spongiae]RKF16148.1 hypothetical protein D6850_00840 [Roseovarius spongiae]